MFRKNDCLAELSHVVRYMGCRLARLGRDPAFLCCLSLKLAPTSGSAPKQDGDGRDAPDRRPPGHESLCDILGGGSGPGTIRHSGERVGYAESVG